MKREIMETKDIPMRTETNASYCEVPIVARSRSYQQPIEEALEQTREAMKQRMLSRG